MLRLAPISPVRCSARKIKQESHAVFSPKYYFSKHVLLSHGSCQVETYFYLREI